MKNKRTYNFKIISPFIFLLMKSSLETKNIVISYIRNRTY